MTGLLHDDAEKEAAAGTSLRDGSFAARLEARAMPSPEDLHDGNRTNGDRARAYWDDIRKGRPMPSRDDLDPAAIKPLLPYLLLIEVCRDPLDFRFRVVGTEVDRIVARSYTGARFSDLPHMRRGNKVWAEYERVVESGAPLCSEIDYVGKADHVRRVHHALFPLSNDGRTVEAICTVIDVELRW